MNIDILKHFENNNGENNIAIFKLKEGEKDEFLSKLPKSFRSQYISDDDLKWRFNNIPDSIRCNEILEKLPSLKHLQSGEFGELFLCFFIPEKYELIPTLIPPKWKWKEGKNNPPHFTDIMVFKQLDENNPTEDDFLISVESKVRATKPKNNESSLQKAILDANKDYLSRLAESLTQINTKYKDEKNTEALGLLERFINPVNHPTYQKRFVAAAVVEDEFGDQHINNVSNIPTDIKDTFQVILVRIKDLKEIYEKTYMQMPNT